MYVCIHSGAQMTREEITCRQLSHKIYTHNTCVIYYILTCITKTYESNTHTYIAHTHTSLVLGNTRFSCVCVCGGVYNQRQQISRPLSHQIYTLIYIHMHIYIYACTYAYTPRFIESRCIRGVEMNLQNIVSFTGLFCKRDL